MRIGFIADVHLGNHARWGGPVKSSLNRRCSEALSVLGRVAQLDFEHLVVLGDLFDVASPSPQLVARAYDWLAKDNGLKSIHMLVGNHERVSFDDRDHALAVFEAFQNEDGLFLVYGTQSCGSVSMTSNVGHISFLPYVAGDFPSALRQRMADSPLHDGPFVLAFHAGISDARTPPWLRGAKDSIDVGELARICKFHGATHVFAGNWHDHRRWDVDGVKIMQVGALVPTGFDNPGFDGYGTVAVLETDTGDVETSVIPGPRFVKVRSFEEMTAAVRRARQEGHVLYVEATVPAERVGEVRAAAAAEYLEHGDGESCVRGLDVLSEEAEARACARRAAEAARSADSVDEALAAFVARMELDPAIDRDAVLAHARRYIG